MHDESQDDGLYEHRWLVPPSVLVVAAAVLGPGFLAAGLDWREWVETWPVVVFMALVFGWFHFMVGRHVNRWVRVDRRGIWVDGELVVRTQQIRGLSVSGEERIHHINSVTPKRLDRGYWRQAAWVSLHEDPDWPWAGVVTRERDLHRGSWLGAVVVATSKSMGPGVREAWSIATYHPGRLLAALVQIAPDAEGPLEDWPEELAAMQQAEAADD